MYARRRGGEQVIGEEDEEYREDDRALGYTSIECRLERKLSTMTAIDLLERKLPILYCSIILSIRQFR